MESASPRKAATSPRAALADKIAKGADAAEATRRVADRQSADERRHSKDQEDVRDVASEDVRDRQVGIAAEAGHDVHD